MRTKRAFTLIEILIAAAIFAIVMLIVVATISRTSAYQTKVNDSRDTAEQARRLAQMISEDVRNARGGTVIYNGLDVNTREVYSSGVLLIHCNERVKGNPTDDEYSECAPIYNRIPGHDLGDNAANILMIFSDTAKFYLNYHGRVFYVADRKLPLTVSSAAIDTPWSYVVDSAALSKYLSELISNDENQNIILPSMASASGSKSDPYEASVRFTGYGPERNATEKQQPFVRFQVNVRTKNYKELAANARAETTIESTIASRNYNWNLIQTPKASVMYDSTWKRVMAVFDMTISDPRITVVNSDGTEMPEEKMDAFPLGGYQSASSYDTQPASYTIKYTFEGIEYTSSRAF